MEFFTSLALVLTVIFCVAFFFKSIIVIFSTKFVRAALLMVLGYFLLFSLLGAEQPTDDDLYILKVMELCVDIGDYNKAVDCFAILEERCSGQKIDEGECRQTWFNVGAKANALMIKAALKRDTEYRNRIGREQVIKWKFTRSC